MEKVIYKSETTVHDILNEVADEVCEKICKYRDIIMADPEDEIEVVKRCGECPVMMLVER